MRPSIILLSVVLLALVQTGCYTRGPWHVESVDGPLNETGSRSSTLARELKPPWFVPTGEYTERAWLNRRGRRVPFESVTKGIDSYCANLPEFRQWTALQAYTDDTQLKFAPAKFWIVSVDPIAVIMLPFTVPNPDSRSLDELGQAKDDRALLSSILANRYNFGTRIEGASSLQWFVVGRSHGLVTEHFDGRQLMLTNGDLVLVLTKSLDGKIDVTRRAQ
ncbi:MAG: hypothetical protein JWQ04_1154 [Pedosphaera sp.]|nr:hypothetical protein [Pedosphaera sp.]